MNGEPPRVEVAFWMDDELQACGIYEIDQLGCTPVVGDIIIDKLPEFFGPLKVRRRVFVPMTAERDVWWLICDPLPDDKELESLLAFDKEMRLELKQVEDEARGEERQETARSLRKLTLKRSKRPSHKKMLKDEFGDD